MKRLFVSLSALFVLILLVTWSQKVLSDRAERLASLAEETALLLSEKETEEEGLRFLSELISEFDRSHLLFGAFVSDLRLHEIRRALSRAERLSGEGEISPALEALSDLSGLFREISDAHRPSLENIL